MESSEWPRSVLAPSITLQALSNAELNGIRLADDQGRLTLKGVCAFWAVVSLIACALTYYLGRFYSPLLFRTYPRLSDRDKREWDVRYASMPHSFLCVWFAYVMLWKSDFFFKESEVPSMLRSNEITHTMLGISWGYFVVDFLVCLKYHMGGNEMLLHHVGSLSSVTAAIITGKGHMHALWMLVTEFTTPFINFRWWFDKAGMKSSPLYFYNGVCILVGWFLARIVVFPPFFYVVYQQREQVKYLNSGTKLLLFVFPPILYMLNLFWFHKIVKGVMKMLNKPATKKE